MTLQARRLIRKMRGGAQAHLLEASDGHAYVVKFANNPQHRRILINEWIAAAFLDYLGIATPPVALVEITPEFLEAEPEAAMTRGRERVRPETGWHFGSRFPGPPLRTVVYDFLPDPLLPKVENLSDFLGTLVFDKWMGNADSRQSIFFRARVTEAGNPTGEEKQRLGFVAQMIDNGYVFEGPHWRFADSPLQGLYFRRLVYDGVQGLDSFEPWLERIRHFPEEVVDQAIKRIPPGWFQAASAEPGGQRLRDVAAQEQDALEAVLERLLKRRSRVADLVEQTHEQADQTFPNWR